MAEVVNLQQVLDALAAGGVEADTLLTAVGEMASVPAGGFNTPVNTLYTLESANGTPLANVINISQQAASEAAQLGNSNIAGAAGTFTGSQGASAAAGQTAGMSSFFGGATKFLNQTVIGTEHFGVGTVAAPIAAVAVGARLGKTFDSLVYKTGKFFGLDMAETLNPATWDSITYDMADTGLEGVYKRGLQLLLGLNSDTGKVEAYMPQDAFNYMAYVLAKAGYFDSGNEGSRIAEAPAGVTVDAAYVRAHGTQVLTNTATYGKYPMWILSSDAGKSGFVVYGQKSSASSTSASRSGIVFATEPGVSIWTVQQTFGGGLTNFQRKQLSTLKGGVYTNTSIGPTETLPYQVLHGFYIGDFVGSMISAENQAFAFLGDGSAYVNLPATSPVEGAGDQPGATIPPISSTNTEQEVADAINNTFPDMEGNRVEMPVAVPATVPKPVTYVQVPLPSTVAGNNPTVEPTATPQADPNIDPQTATDPLSALLLKLLTGKQAINMPNPEADPEQYPEGKPEEPVNTNPAGVGTGVTPPLVVPVGSASALWAVYNPTQAEINSLGAWLWSNNFVDQLLKMFNDPMQAIIGLHKTFIPPITGAAQDIKVGYLNSGVSALTVPVQYSSVDCGTIDCAEYFGSVFDYAPYTRVYLYLPFIGFKELDVAQVMRGRINVRYHGDAFTGTCLAEVSITRDGSAGGVLYTFSGDCAARYPLSHGSYMGIVNAIAGIGIGVGTALAGAPSIGVAGALGMAQHARASVEHSGSFSGNSGAMGIKKPYLVILRPQTAMANNYKHFTGQPSNSNVVLGSASGYVRVKECHVEDIATATDAEKQMIESALKSGVII